MIKYYDTPLFGIWSSMISESLENNENITRTRGPYSYNDLCF